MCRHGEIGRGAAGGNSERLVARPAQEQTRFTRAANVRMRGVYVAAIAQPCHVHGAVTRGLFCIATWRRV